MNLKIMVFYFEQKKLSEKSQTIKYILYDCMSIKFWKIQTVVMESRSAVAWEWEMGSGVMVCYQGHGNFWQDGYTHFLNCDVVSQVHTYAKISIVHFNRFSLWYVNYASIKLLKIIKQANKYAWQNPTFLLHAHCMLPIVGV